VLLYASFNDYIGKTSIIRKQYYLEHQRPKRAIAIGPKK